MATLYVCGALVEIIGDVFDVLVPSAVPSLLK